MPIVQIQRIAAGGDGVGRLPDGKTVFVPRTAPGDSVELTGLREHQRFARARVGRLVEAGPDRVEPRCPHYEADRCGGCQLQHLSSGAQARIKSAVVGDALRRLGRLDVPDPEILPADSPWGYRTKLTLAVGPGRRHIGFHPWDRPDRVFDLERCEIASPALNSLWSALSPERTLLPGDGTHVVLRLDRTGGLHVIVRATSNRVWSGAAALARALGRHGRAATIWWHPEGGAPRVLAGGAEAFPATVFEQINPGMGDRVRVYATDQLGAVSGRRAWDLYSGIGETTDLLLERGARVESVELDRRAVDQAERRAQARSQIPSGSQRPGEDPVSRHVGRAEDVVKTLSPPDLVITNPPRTGMDARVVDAIALARPERVVYVSCDPATLARDLSRLMKAASGPAAAPSFRVASVRAFDLFPQTAHVEAVVVLEVV